MEIHALTTGTVQVKDAFLHARSGPTRQLRLFTPGAFSDPLPIHAWLVEHAGERILVDTGERAGAKDMPVLVHGAEWAFAQTLQSRFFQRVLRQPVPDGVDFRPVALDAGPFGAFAATRPLTGDGRVVAVATPGHTPGHISVVCIDDEGRHLLLAGDATDTLEQLRARRADAVAPKPKVQVATLDRILDHAQRHATVYLPSHDPGSAARLADRTVL